MRTPLVPWIAVALATPAVAAAEPLRLRADALAIGAQSPAGLLVLSGASRASPGWLSAEALVWAGAGPSDEADVLSVSVLARRGRHGRVRVGRFILSPGALRPAHVDGAAAAVRLPVVDLEVEAFGGMPVVPREGPSGRDWLAGGRVARRLGEWGAVGIGYRQSRAGAQLADEELGADLGLAPHERLDVAASVALDLLQSALAHAHASAVFRPGAVSVELFGTERSTSRILPATSLFSVLGDRPARIAGASLGWRAAPRLDLWARADGGRTGAGPTSDGAAGGTLRLDDRGDGALAAELRRQDGAASAWTGGRVALRVPLGGGFRAAAEVELAAPDAPQGRGRLWPWGLVALGWSLDGWEAAVGLEALESPELASRVDALARLSRRGGLP